ncbi:MAG: OmpA family protein [Bacteroidia bacterium]|nr:OmpA family protein [Bacteroidia bacterium]
MKAWILSISFIFILNFSFSQSAGKLFKQGKEAAEEGKTKEAIDLLSAAINLKVDDDELYVFRAGQYEKIKEYDKAIADYEKALSVRPKDTKVAIRCADLLIQKQDHFKALVVINNALTHEKLNIDLLERKTWCQIKMKNFQDAVVTVETALAENQYNHKLRYYRGLAKDSLKDYATACNEYGRAINLMKQIKPNDVKPQAHFKPYYSNNGKAQYNNAAFDESIKNYTIASTLDAADSVEPKNYQIFYERSFAYLAKNDFTNAIGDLNKAIVMEPNDKKLFLQRGKVYLSTSQYQSAINDFTKNIQLDEKSADALKLRGKCYMELSDYKNAINDFKKLTTLLSSTENKELLADAKLKLYNANKETDAPEIKISYPVVDLSGFVNVMDGQQDVVVEGTIKDKSQLEFIKINGVLAKYTSEEINPEFRCKVPLKGDVRKMDIVVEDIYHNSNSKTIKVGRILSDSKVKVTFAGKILADDGTNNPLTDREVYLVNEKGEVFFVAKTDAFGRFKFENLPYDQPYFLTMDVTDTPLSKTTKFIVADENNKPVIASVTDGERRFKFSILPSDYNTMSLMTLDDAPLFIDIKGKLIAANEGKTPLSFMTVILMNENGEAIASKKTDAYGIFLFSKLLPKGNYSIRTDSLESQSITYTKILVTDENGKIIRELTKNPQGYFRYEILPAYKVQLTKISAVDPWLKTLNLSKEKAELLIIENIYYQSGSWEIMPEAELVLQKAIDALKMNTKLFLEVQAHTDAIAGDDYNMELSQKRASTVVDYMINKGIDKKRLSAKGYGESQLSNRCANGVECSDAEHKQNRRTVFKISYVGN